MLVVVSVMSASVFFCVYGVMSAAEDAWRGIRSTWWRRR
jgi:hypothetical protein